MKMRVKVWNDDIFIDIDQSSKAVWSATGSYLGQTITTKDRTASTAAKRWIEAARYKGN